MELFPFGTPPAGFFSKTVASTAENQQAGKKNDVFFSRDPPFWTPNSKRVKKPGSRDYIIIVHNSITPTPAHSTPLLLGRGGGGPTIFNIRGHGGKQWIIIIWGAL